MTRLRFLFFSLIFNLLFSFLLHAETDYNINDVEKGFHNKGSSTFSIYVSGRVVLDALKVIAPSNLVDNQDGTTLHAGLGAAAGIRQRVSLFLLRYEVDYSFSTRTNSFYHATMLNVYFGVDLPKSPVAPYIMAGIGINVFDPSFENIETNFAYCIGAGVLVYINDSWAIDIATRYMETNMNFRLGVGSSKVNNNNFYVGFIKLF